MLHSTIFWLDRKGHIIGKLGDFGVPGKLSLAGVALKVWAMDLGAMLLVRFLLAKSEAA